MIAVLQSFHTAAPVSMLKREQPLWPLINLGVSATWRHGPARLDWIAANGLACAYTPNPKQLALIPDQITPYIQRGLAVRHHGYFPGKEFGHADAKVAEEAMQLHFKAMEAIHGIGEQLLTVHVGLDQTLPLDHHRTVQNLIRLVQYGKKIGVTVSLENLRYGPSSNPETLLEWSYRSGAGITLDVGHALSSSCVRKKTISAEKIIDLTAGRLLEVHLYESETDRHWAPKNMDVLGPIIDQLIKTNCRWWTIELEDTREVLSTRQMLADYLDKAKTKIDLQPETEDGCVL